MNQRELTELAAAGLRAIKCKAPDFFICTLPDCENIDACICDIPTARVDSMYIYLMSDELPLLPIWLDIETKERDNNTHRFLNICRKYKNNLI